MITDKYAYKEIPKETNKETGYRVYLTEDGNRLPSVTTILGQTDTKEDKASLIAWQKWMGPKRSKAICTEAANVGTVMHRRLEYHVKGIKKKVGSNMIQQQAYKMSRVIVDNGLKHVNEVWGSEVQLYFPGLFAGTTDLVGLWKGNPAIMDFKQSNKLKKEEYVQNYKMQICAYSMAHNEMYDTNIDQGVIFICTRDFTYQQFMIEGNEFKQYTNKWLKRLDRFYNVI